MIIVNARFITQKVTGVQRFAVEICKRLKLMNPSVRFVAPKGAIDKQLANFLAVEEIGSNGGSLWEQWDLPLFLRGEGNPLLINFCNTAPLFYKNQVSTIHDMSYKVNPKWFSKQFYFWYNLLIPTIANVSKQIITVSNASKNDIQHYLKIDASKIKVVYNAPFEHAVTSKKDIKGKYLLTISSLDPRKNLNNLLQAFAQLSEDVKLVIVGLKSSNFADAIDASLITDKVEIKGYLSDEELQDLLVNAQAFVYVSLYEGFGLPPIEAMNASCPVIVSDIAAHQEVCADAALYVNPLSVEDIAEGVKRLLNNQDLRAELVAKGKENLQRFSWEQSAKDVLSIINELN